jgi:cyclopropane-fatty-acyl-phospholipid synthase
MPRLTTTAPLRRELRRALPARPFTLAFWDGSRVEATAPGPVFTVTRPEALAHVLWAPGQLGLGRAYVTGGIEVDELDRVMDLVDGWKPPPISARERARLALAALRAVGPVRPPRPPAVELPPDGERHSLARDRRAVRYHYDLPPEFFALYLDATMTYSCAIFSRGATTLEEAQETKLELVCSKLRLQEGQRVLDVGCGWGSFALQAARRHGARVVGITLSEPQARLARERAAEAGLADRVEIRVADYRELGAETFDAIASIGMVEHVGEEQIDLYAAKLASLLRPGGRLLNHGIAQLASEPKAAGPFSERFVFPDGLPLPLWRVERALARAGLVTEHVEGFPQDYVETLTRWAQRLDARHDEAVRLVGEERLRAYRLYLRAARHGFEVGFSSVYQVAASAR